MSSPVWQTIAAGAGTIAVVFVRAFMKERARRAADTTLIDTAAKALEDTLEELAGYRAPAVPTPVPPTPPDPRKRLNAAITAAGLGARPTKGAPR